MTTIYINDKSQRRKESKTNLVSKINVRIFKMIIHSLNDDELILKQKYSQCDRSFISQRNCNLEKPSESLVAQNKENLLSNDFDLICSSINFFTQNFNSIDLEILNTIFGLNYEIIIKDDSLSENSIKENIFNIDDCINGLISEISEYNMFLKNTEFAKIIVDFLIGFSISEENQFAVTAYRSISNFIYSNNDVAEYLLDEFLEECFNRFQTIVTEFAHVIFSLSSENLNNNDDTDEISDYLYLIESILKIFSAMFFHPNLISFEFSSNVVKCFHDLLSIETPIDNLKVFVIDNVYWFAISAPDESIENLLTPQFIDLIMSFLELEDLKDTIKLSLFECIGKITKHDDKFSLLFIQEPIELLNKTNNYNEWSDETKYSFLKILRNFTACNDITPSLNIICSAEITEFLESIFHSCSFKAQKEAYIILFYLIMSKNNDIIGYVLSNFSDFFTNLIDFLTLGDQSFNQLCLYSIYICSNYFESQSNEDKNQFLDIFKDSEWGDLFDSFSTSSDEKISQLTHLLIDIIEDEN